MNEFGSQGYNPQEQNKATPASGEALTNQARNPYASKGVNDMEGNNGPENTRPQSNQNPINSPGERPHNAGQPPRTGAERPWDPIDTPLQAARENRVAGAQMRGPEVLGDETERRAAWMHKFRQDGLNVDRPSVDDRRSMEWVINSGTWPEGMGPGFGAPSDRGFPAREPGVETKERTAQEALDALDQSIIRRQNAGRPPMRSEVEKWRRERINETGQDPFPNEEEHPSDRKPKNMEELFDEIVKNSNPKYGKGGAHDLWKRDAEGNKEAPNQANFLVWVMDRITFFHSENPDDTSLNVFAKVKLEREFRDIAIGDMFENEDVYFTDADKNFYKDMADQARLIVWQFSEYRKDSIEYYQNMGDVENIKKLLTNQFYTNKHTKAAFHGRSVLANLMTLAENYDSTPQTFEQRQKDVSASEPENDTNLGQGLNTAFLIYYNLSDTEKLKGMLSKEEYDILLNPDRARYHIIKSAVGKKFITGDLATKIDEFDNFDLSKLTPAQLEQAKRYIESVDPSKADASGEFLFNGEKVETGSAKMAQFVNIYNNSTKHTEITSVANDLIKDVIMKRYGLNETSAGYAQLMAQFMARPMGAGWRNDLLANANDAATKPGKLLAYRKKMFEGSRVGMGGNPYSVFMFKSAFVDFLTAARSETLVTNEDGSIYEDAYGKRHNYSLMEMMEMMHEKGSDTQGNNKEIMYLANRLKPTTNAEKVWATDHMSNGLAMYDQLINNQELDWHKFTEIDTTGIKPKAVLNRAAFQKEVRDGLFKQTRYLLSTYGQLDFSLNVRYHDPLGGPDHKGEWKDEPLALALFGQEILDIPEFWKKDMAWNADGTPKMEEYKDAHGDTKERQKVLKVYEHEIDPLLIQQDKTTLWKQVALARIVADVTAHRDQFSTDKKYNMMYWMHMLHELEHVQVDLVGNEFDHRQTHGVGHAFSEGQIEWLKKHGDISTSSLVKQQAVRDIFGGVFEGFGKALQEFFKGVKV